MMERDTAVAFDALAAMPNAFLRPSAGRPSRTLKNLLQEAGVPEWQRDRLPLVFAGDALIWVPGVGQDCHFAATAEEPGLMLHWDPSTPGTARPVRSSRA